MNRKFHLYRIRDYALKGKNLSERGLKSLIHEGPVTALRKVKRYLTVRQDDMCHWMKEPLYSDEQLQEQREQVFSGDCKVSIITPLYNTNERHLREMLDSVVAQTFHNWELCLADGSDDSSDKVSEICRKYEEKDSRIRYVKLEKNHGIAGNSNVAVSMSTGEYLALLDHDDILHPAALYEVVKAFSEHQVDFVYTDEATFMDPNLSDITFVHLKPDFAPDNLKSNNYICHFTAFRRGLMDSCGAFREGYDGSQDHELILRLTAGARKIIHIPRVLYYWRAHADSAALQTENKSYATKAGILAISDYLKGKGVSATVGQSKGIPTIYRVSYVIEGTPKVSIIIPNRNHLKDLAGCIFSIKKYTSYRNYEIIIVENGSRDRKVFQYYQGIQEKDKQIKVIRWNREFNWSAINNFAVKKATGEYLLFLNNDTEIITPQWIEELLMHAQRAEVGAVGAMLYYPDNTIQHAGVVIGLNGVAAHSFPHARRGEVGYAGKLCYTQNMSAVTGACMMTRKSVWDKVGGFDESFAVSFNDIDYCIRIRKKGYLVVWTPYAELYHWESKSRGRAGFGSRKKELLRSAEAFREKWRMELEAGDPYYNPNFSLRGDGYLLERRSSEG